MKKNKGKLCLGTDRGKMNEKRKEKELRVRNNEQFCYRNSYGRNHDFEFSMYFRGILCVFIFRLYREEHCKRREIDVKENN